MMKERDQLMLFTEDELASGLSLLSSRQNAQEVARLVSAIPEAERPSYRWAHEVVLLVSSVSPSIAERVRHHYGRDDEIRGLIGRQQEQFARWLGASAGERGQGRYRLQDVVIDVRSGAPANMVPAYVAPRPATAGNPLAIASEAELATALSLLAPESNAREVAAAVYSIPPADQVHYDWAQAAVMLLGCVSDEVSERVLAHFARTVEERDEMQRQQRSYREFVLTQGNKRETIFDLESVVFDRRQDPT
jgi:hypothetical protein